MSVSAGGEPRRRIIPGSDASTDVVEAETAEEAAEEAVKQTVLEELEWEDLDFQGPRPSVDEDLQTAKPHTPAQARRFAESVRSKGVMWPLACASDGRIVDGIHRFLEAERQGVGFEVRYLKDVYSDARLREISRELNHVRRHLSPEDWAIDDEAIEKSLRENPKLSNRKRAQQLDTNDVKVGRAKRRLATRGVRHVAPVVTDSARDTELPESGEQVFPATRTGRSIPRRSEVEIDKSTTTSPPDIEAPETSDLVQQPSLRPRLSTELDAARRRRGDARHPLGQPVQGRRPEGVPDDGDGVAGVPQPHHHRLHRGGILR